ncbi:MAG: ribonuclease HI family protein [Aquificae bacterium]|nr:ribonuclease HI family protein [Aquificota bacterium]
MKRAIVLEKDFLRALSKKGKKDFLKEIERLSKEAELLLIKDEKGYREINSPEELWEELSGTGLGFFDGTSLGGEGAIGVVLISPNKTLTLSERVGRATSNEAEYKALIRLLEEAKREGLRKLKVKGDSELVIKQVRGEYKVREERLRKLYERVKELESGFDEVSYEWVPRSENKEADKLSRKAFQGSTR